MNKLGFGIIGPGNIARKFADAVNRTDDAYIAAAASKNIEKAERFAEEFTIDSFYNDYDAMCKDPNVDVVYISTTNNFHYENILLCIENNKHVICEKPMVMTKSQAIDVFEKAKRNKLFVMEAMWTRFLPSYSKAKELLSNGQIGDIKHINSYFSLFLQYDPKGRLFNKALGGGVLYDLGVYNILAALFFMDEKPSEYTGYARICTEGTDINDTVIMKFPSGATAGFVCGSEIKTPNGMTIYGTKGNIILHEKITDCRKISLAKDDAPLESFEFEYENGFVYQILEVISCINSKKLQSEIMPWQATIDCIEIIEGLLKKWGLENTI